MPTRRRRRDSHTSTKPTKKKEKSKSNSNNNENSNTNLTNKIAPKIKNNFVNKRTVGQSPFARSI